MKREDFNRKILKKGLFKNTRKTSGEEKTRKETPAGPSAISAEKRAPEGMRQLPETLQVVKFRLNEYEFGLDISQIEKVIWMVEITKVPNAPSILEGIIDLQGRIIPVIDLHKVLGLAWGDYRKDTQIIIATTGDKELGIIIDKIQHVININSRDILMPDKNVPHKEILLGVAETSGGLMPILDLEKVIPLNEEELENLVFDEKQKAKGMPAVEAENEELRNLFHKRALDLAEKREVKEEDTENFLVFAIENEWYALDLTNIKEELVPFSIVPLPSVSSSVLGVINLRGDILAVVDLKSLFELSRGEEKSPKSRFIVIEKGDAKFCLVVDKVEEIYNLPLNSIEPPLSTIEEVKMGYLKGEISYMDKLIGLIDLDNIIKAVSGSGEVRGLK